MRTTHAELAHVTRILTMGELTASIAHEVKAGAVEFLTKPFVEEDLLDSVQQAIKYSRTAGRQKAETERLNDLYASLTPREREVMDLVVSGLLNKQIAADLVRMSEALRRR